jgi:hypothetical protein
MSVQDATATTSNPFKQDLERERDPLVVPTQGQGKTWRGSVVKVLKEGVVSGVASALINLIPGGVFSPNNGAGTIVVASGTGFAAAGSATFAGKSVTKLSEKFHWNWALRMATGALGSFAFGWGLLNQWSLFATGNMMPVTIQVWGPLPFAAAGGIFAAATDTWGTFLSVSTGTASLVSLGMGVGLGQAILGEENMGTRLGACLGFAAGFISEMCAGAVDGVVFCLDKDSKI